MSSTQESGHGKNVAAFEQLVSFCKGYGTSYNPAKDSLKISNLETVFKNATTLFAKVVTTKQALNNAINSRATTFDSVKALLTRISSGLQAFGVSELTLADVKGIMRKMRGERAGSSAKKAAVTKDGEAIRTISAAQTGYDSQVEHMSRLVELLGKEAAYKPNEADLKVSALEGLLAKMKGANSTVAGAYTDYRNALAARDAFLYNDLTGLVQLSKQVKLYVKSVYGAQSAQYKQVSGLAFKEVG